MSDPHRLKTGNPERVVVPHAAGEQGELTSQGMLAPINDFVDSAGNLTAVSFRFLYSLWADIQALKASTSVLQLQALVNAVGQQFSIAQNAPMTPPVSAGAGALFTGVGFYFTPKSTRVQVTIEGSIYNSMAGGVSIAFLVWGTGTFPGANAPYMGPPGQILFGQYIRSTATAANSATPFSAPGVINGLTPNQQVWTDLLIASGSGSTSVSDLQTQVIGLIDPVS